MAMPPARGMGPRWTLRRSGLSTQPRRLQRARHAGVTASVSSRAETASISRESMEFRSQKAEVRSQESEVRSQEPRLLEGIMAYWGDSAKTFAGIIPWTADSSTACMSRAWRSRLYLGAASRLRSEEHTSEL